MGCGAICGQSTAIDSLTCRHSQQTMQGLLPLLNKNSKYASKHTVQSFVAEYNNHPNIFHLQAKPYLTKHQPVSSKLLLKWKIILFALDGDQKGYSDCLELADCRTEQPEETQETTFFGSTGQKSIIFHQCFVQIQKDLDRTIALSQSRKKQFENILKGITNYFPKMGYTQGLNFIIGYLIIAGFSQNDTFWIFVHIAINRRYLLLGLYEDNFPLSNVFTTVFKNILKRQNPALYQHMFQDLYVDPAMWIFKWFTTCFLYSFPIEMIKYPLDVTIQKGSFGIVTFAVGITKELAATLLQIDDIADISTFLSSLKTIQCFNKHINLQRVMKQAYGLEIISADFDGLEETGGFYGEYLQGVISKEQAQNQKISTKLTENSQIRDQSKLDQKLQNWYKTLLDDRIKFRIKHKASSSSQSSPLLQINSINKSFVGKDKSSQKIEIQVLQMDEPDLTAPTITMPERVTRRGSFDMHQDLDVKQRRLGHLANEIIEGLEEQSSERSSHREKQEKRSKKSKIGQILELDELDKLELDFSTKINKSVKINNYAPPKSVPREPTTKQDSSFTGLRINNYNGITNKHSNTFTLAARNTLRADTFDAVSVSSKHTNTNRSTRNNTKPPIDIPARNSRICGCKTKTQENKFSSLDRNSEMGSSKDQFSDKDSMSINQYSHNEQPIINQNLSIHNADSHRQRVSTHNDFMVNSHGPSLKDKPPIHIKQEQKKSEVQVEVVVPIFKRDRKHKDRRISHIEIATNENKDKLFNIGWEAESEIESIAPISCKKESQINSQKRCKECEGGGCTNHCEVESIR